MVQEIPLTAITIGDRFRKDLGDIAGLAASIAAHGLLHPIVLSRTHHLIVGRRRLAAYAHLGRATIPAVLLDLEDPLGAELAENEERKAFAPSEKVAIAEAIFLHQTAAAKKRQQVHGKTAPGTKKHTSGNLPEVLEPHPPARDIAACAVGWSGRTYERAKKVVEAAREDEELQPLVERMDKTGNISRAYMQLPIYVRTSDEDEDQVPAPHRPVSYATIVKRVDHVMQNTMVPNLRRLQDEDRAYLRTLLHFYLTMIDKEEEAAHAGRAL